MGIIEGLAARLNLAGDRKFNQNENRVPVGNPDVYSPGISAEDEYKLQLVQKAREANAKAAYDKLVADAYNASKAGVAQANEAKRFNMEVGGWDGPFKDETNPVYRQFNVDPGLAAKWMSSYKGR